MTIEGVLIMSVATKSKIDNLVSLANNPFLIEENKRRLAVAKTTLEAKKQALEELKMQTDISYIDQSAAEMAEEVIKVSARETDAVNSLIAVGKEELNANSLLEESYRKSIMVLLDKIDDYEKKISELEIEQDKKLPKASLEVLTNTIGIYNDELVRANLKLADLKAKLTLLIIAATEIKIKLAKLESRLKGLKQEDSSLEENNSLNDYASKAISESRLLALETEIKSLEEQIAFYSLDPVTLAEEIKAMLDKEETDDLISKINTLTKRANAFSEISEYPEYSIRRVVEETTGELENKIKFSSESLVQHQFATAQKNADVISLAALIAGYKVSIYNLERMAEEINGELANADTERKDYLKSIKNAIESSLKTINGLILKKETELSDIVSYLSEIRLAQTVSQISINSINERIILKESKEPKAKDYESRLTQIEMSLAINDTRITPQEIKSELIKEISGESNDLSELDIGGEVYDIGPKALKSDEMTSAGKLSEDVTISRLEEPVVAKESEPADEFEIIPQEINYEEEKPALELLGGAKLVTPSEPNHIEVNIEDVLKDQKKASSKVKNTRLVNITNREGLFKGIKERYNKPKILSLERAA